MSIEVHCPWGYAYEEMAIDNSPQLAALTGQTFDAVVVPHHGAAASANQIPPPANRDMSIYFFSAGDHKGYNHPTTVSMDNHVALGYVKIENHCCADVIAQQLRP